MAAHPVISSEEAKEKKIIGNLKSQSELQPP